MVHQRVANAAVLGRLCVRLTLACAAAVPIKCEGAAAADFPKMKRRPHPRYRSPAVSHQAALESGALLGRKSIPIGPRHGMPLMLSDLAADPPSERGAPDYH